MGVGGSCGFGTIGVSGSSTDLFALELDVLLVVVVDVKTKSGRVDIAVAPNEEGTKDRLRQNIKDAVLYKTQVSCTVTFSTHYDKKVLTAC